MKKILLSVVMLLCSLPLLLAQYAEPALTGANFVPGTSEVGQSSTLTISFSNSGSSPIPASSIELTISTASNYYSSDGTSIPGGAGGALFTWTYLGKDTWRGSNTSTIPAFGGGVITLQVRGTVVSPGFEVTNINVQPVNSFSAFTDSPNNNNLQPKLKIVAATSTPYIFAYDDFGVSSKGVPITNNVLSNDDIGTGVSPLVIVTTPVTSPTNGTVSINANGRYTYQPNANFVGTDSFVYRVCDSGNPAVCATATVTITVIDPGVGNGNKAPIAAPDNIAVKQGATATGNVLLNDVELDANQTLTAAVVTQPTKGTLTLNANGSYSYVAGANSLGDDWFTYKACDNGNPQLCSTTRVDINIYASSAVNLPPVANADVVLRDPSSTATGNVLTNDKDPEGGTLTVTTTPVVVPTNGTVVLSANGAFTYTPTAGYTGMDQFVYEVCDSYNPKACSQATVFIVPRSVATGEANVSLSKTLIGNKIRTLNETVSYRVVLKNVGPAAATNVVVKDSLSTGLQLVSGTSTVGTFSNGQWSVPALASGDSAVLTVSVKLAVAGISFNYARVVSLDQTDSNKSNNESEACVSVPYQLCATEKMEVSVSASYTNVKWFKEGIQVATGNVVLLSEAGNYTFTANNINCPVSGCCPLVIEAGTNCCPVNICIPLTIKRVKK